MEKRVNLIALLKTMFQNERIRVVIYFENSDDELIFSGEVRKVAKTLNPKYNEFIVDFVEVWPFDERIINLHAYENERAIAR